MEEVNPFCKPLILTSVDISPKKHVDAIEVRSFYRHGSWFPYSLSIKGEGDWMWQRGLYPFATVTGDYVWWTYRNVAYTNKDDFLLAEDEHLVSVRHVNVESDMYPVQLDFVVFRDPDLSQPGVNDELEIVHEENSHSEKVTLLEEKTISMLPEIE